MHVVIGGCGRVGSALAANLEGLGHTVAVMDKDPVAFDNLRASFSGKKVTGFVFDRDVLEEAGIKEAAAYAAVTSGDNSNIVSARVVREHYRLERVVARIYDPRRAQVYQRLGIQTVATVRWATDQALRILLPDEAPVEYTVDNGEVVIVPVAAPAEIIGRDAFELEAEGSRRIVAVSRFGAPRLPTKELTIQDGDILHLSVPRGGVNDLLEELKKVGSPQ